MKQFFRIFFLLLMAGTAIAESSSRIRNSELAFDGVALGDTEASVLQKLGKPLRTTDTGEGRQLFYHGLTIRSGTFDKWDCGMQCRVDELLSTSPQRCTPSGVCPGMKLDEVKVPQGKLIVADGEGQAFVEFPSDESACWLQLALDNGIVTSVRAACQP